MCRGIDVPAANAAQFAVIFWVVSTATTRYRTKNSSSSSMSVYTGSASEWDKIMIVLSGFTSFFSLGKLIIAMKCYGNDTDFTSVNDT